MAAIATQNAPAVPQPKFKPIVELPKPSDGTGSTAFDPIKHLAYIAPSNVIMMKDLGYDEDVGVSPVAVSQPFQLFSEEAIREMRSEIFKPEVMQNCSYKSNIAACQLRGYASRYAPFTYDAWHNPETLDIVSKLAGVDLIPAMDFELGHINISVKTEEQTQNELEIIRKQKSFFADDEGIAGCPWEDDKPIVGWHRDSYPWVAVTMLSDCTNMVGGETALQAADGSVMKVRGPGMERITSVTSFRPRSAHLKDDTVLNTIRPISDLSEVYYEFGEYRLEMLEERIKTRLKELRANRRVGRKFCTSAFKSFLREQEAFLKHTDTEMVQDEDVIPGFIEEMDIPNVVVGGGEEPQSTKKRARVE